MIELELMGNGSGEAYLGYGDYVNKVVNNNWEYFNEKIKDSSYNISVDILENYFAEDELLELSELVKSGEFTKENSIRVFEAVFAQKVNHWLALNKLLINYHEVSKFIPSEKLPSFLRSQSLSNRNWMHLSGKGQIEKVVIDGEIYSSLECLAVV